MVRNQPDIDVEIQQSPKIKSCKIPRIIRISSHEPVPVEMKKKVLDRAKRACEYPKCKENKLLQFHHKNLKNTDNRASNIELLCPNHHRSGHNGDDFVSRHPWKKEFERRYGSEWELYEQVKQIISDQGDRLIGLLVQQDD